MFATGPRVATSVALTALLGFVLAVVSVGALAASEPQTTDWQAFGTGWAVNRGNGYGSPDVQLSSVTKKHPADVRYWIKNHAAQARDVTVYWDLECWVRVDGFNDTVTDRSGSFDATIGPNKKLFRNPFYNAGAEWCQVDVWVDYGFDNFADNGKLTMKFEAKY